VNELFAVISKRSILGVSRTLVIVAVVVVVIVAGVGAYLIIQPPAEAAEQTLILGTTENPRNIDPSVDASIGTVLITNLVFDSLLQFETPDCVDVVPELAAEWTVSADGKTYEFTLRQDVKFHDGTDLTAEDVKFGIERALDLGAPLRSFYVDIEQMEILDTYRIRIQHKNPTALFPKIMAMSIHAAIIPKNVIEQAGDDWGKTVYVGSGPFKFVEFIENEKIVLERNDNYWGKKPKLEKIIMLLNMDPTTAKMALERGDIDVFYERPLSIDIPSLIADPDIEAKSHPTHHLRYITFNFNAPGPHHNKLVRQAICYAIDPERVWEWGYKEEGQITYSMCNPIVTPYYKPVFEKYKYDLDKAKALLAQAGYPDGFEIEAVLHTALDPLDPDAMLVVKEDLAKVGIDLTVNVEELGAWYEKILTTPMSITGWATSVADPEWCMMATLHLDYGYINPWWINWNNTRYTELGYLGKAELDLATREEIYDEAQDILAEECPVYPIKASSRWVFIRNWVKDFTFYPSHWTDDISFTDVYIAPRD
jgi:peptide/nickel transport system substrate-binding protein